MKKVIMRKVHLKTEGIRGIYEIRNTCNVCGKEFVSEAPQKALYCDPCKKEVQKEQGRLRAQKFRDRKKEKETGWMK